MNYYIIAGEASGDLHASNLMKALKKKDLEAKFRFWGGDLMFKQGGSLVKHYKDLAFMGFWEVIKNLPTILCNIEFCKKDIRKNRPDILVLVDYPGFNLRIAKFAKNLGIKVVYYISPQLWAWKEDRIKIIKKYVDEIITILPFEKDFYKKHFVEAHFSGHPLLEVISELEPIDEKKFREDNLLGEKEIIALLPGSRKQEIEKMLEIMTSVSFYFKEYQFVIAGAPSVDEEFYRKCINDNIHLISNKTYDLLRCSKAALVSSGTATLETALFSVPQVVCYKGNKISYLIAKRLVKHIRYISLVNLIMEKEVVKELIQDDLNTENLIRELSIILLKERKNQILKDYEELYQKLGSAKASENAANIVVNLLA